MPAPSCKPNIANAGVKVGFGSRGHSATTPAPGGKPGESVWMSSLFGSGRVALTDTWRGGFDVQLASNKTYLHRYEFSNQDRLTTDLFVDRVSGRSRGEITGYYFQSLRATDTVGQIPIGIAADAIHLHPRIPGLGRAAQGRHQRALSEP